MAKRFKVSRGGGCSVVKFSAVQNIETHLKLAVNQLCCVTLLKGPVLRLQSVIDAYIPNLRVCFDLKRTLISHAHSFLITAV